MLTVKDTQISEALGEFVKEESAYQSLDNSFIIIKLEKLKNNDEIRIGALHKESISSYLSEAKVKDKAFGFFDFKGITVVLFGEKNNHFFDKTNSKRSFSFFNIKSKKKIKKGAFYPPPTIYEPIVWIYIYEKGKLRLTDKGRFTLLH